jgi:putative transcriptional regulator
MDAGSTPVPSDLSGHFLIAETDLQDPNFFRTVVLVIHHNSEGAFGLVINRESEVTAGEVIEGVEDCPLVTEPIHVGGPVQQNYVFALHSGIPRRYRSEHSEETAPGVIFEPSFQHLIDYAHSEDYLAEPIEDRPAIRIFAGYSGWGPGQLEGELTEDAWYVHAASADLVFSADSAEGWKAALSRKGSFFRIVAETGFKPSRN